MKFSSIVRQLKREAAANPKKAGFLGVLALVAVWFWVPLVWGLIGPEEESTEVATSPATGSAMTATQKFGPIQQPTGSLGENGVLTAPDRGGLAWNQLVEWMGNDPRLLASSYVPGPRDPFREPQAPQVADHENEKAPVPQLVTPADLGMTLSSTIIGSGRRVARIGGKNYTQGSTVEGDKDGQRIKFTLAEIHPRRVVLIRESRPFELKVPSPGQSSRIELTRNEN